MTANGWRDLVRVTHGRGLEIGPLLAPRVRKDEARIDYLDHVNRDDLLEKYRFDPSMQDRLDQVVEVDLVHEPGQRLIEAVGDRRYDFVVASHVFEHLPDPVGWLDQVAEVVRPQGRLVLIIPDKRYCFDVNRTLTRPAELVDAYLRRLTAPDCRSIFDYESATIDVDLAQIWSGAEDYAGAWREQEVHPYLGAYARCLEVAESGCWVDIHVSTFTPESFLDNLAALAEIGLCPFELVGWYPTEDGGYEFAVVLQLLEPELGRDARRDAVLRSIPEHDSALEHAILRHRAPCPTGVAAGNVGAPDVAADPSVEQEPSEPAVPSNSMIVSRAERTLLEQKRRMFDAARRIASRLRA